MWFWPTELTLFWFVEKYKIVHSALKLNSNIGHDDTQNQVLAGTTMFAVFVSRPFSVRSCEKYTFFLILCLA